MKKIDVIIPVYNGEKYIEKTIKSLLEQTCQEFDIIVIDDASTDNSVSIIEQFHDARIHIFHNKINKGIAYSRNRAIELCDKEYIAIMDHDDIAPPYRLEHELQFLEEKKQIHIVGGHTRRIDGNGKDMNKQWSVYLNPDYIRAYLLLGNTIVNTSVMMRKQFILDHDIRYRDYQMGAEDYRFWIDCLLAGAQFANLDEVLVYWRNGHNNVTQQMKREKLKERYRVLSDIHRTALEGSGFQLSDEEYNVLNKVFMEEGSVDSDEEIKALYQSLKKIAMQARDHNLNNANEIVTMCRKRFGEKIGKAFYLWERG